MRKISITEALNELKLYDSKITKAITNVTLCGATKKSSDKVGVVKKEDFEDRAKASYQSVTDLIANRNTLKSAVVKSNTVTEVTVTDKIMTVTEAIERKNSIEYDETLLNEMQMLLLLLIRRIRKLMQRLMICLLLLSEKILIRN